MQNKINSHKLEFYRELLRLYTRYRNTGAENENSIISLSKI